MDEKLQEKLKLEADIKLLTRKKETSLDELTSVEEQVKKRTVELTSDVKRLTQEKKELIDYLNAHYKTLALYEDIVQRVRKGVLTFGSDEYQRAKDKADTQLEVAEKIYTKVKDKLRSVVVKEAVLNVKEKSLSSLNDTLKREKEELEAESDHIRVKSKEISTLEAKIEADKEKVQEDTSQAQTLLKEAKYEHFKVFRRVGEKERQATELLDIIKKGLSDVNLERDKIKGRQDYLVKKDEELKAIAIRLKYRQARIK